MRSQSPVDYAWASGTEHLVVVGPLCLLVGFFLMLGVASAGAPSVVRLSKVVIGDES